MDILKDRDRLAECFRLLDRLWESGTANMLDCSEFSRRAFLNLLERKLRGRELPDSELRHIAEHTWREFLRGA